MELNYTLNNIKKLLPSKFKHILWYIFKAPQRKLSNGSLIRDIFGIYIQYKYKFSNNKNLHPITVCTGLYNRSENYIQNLLYSLNNCDNKELINISIFDCESNDISDLKNKIKEKWNGDLQFNSKNTKFSRAITFNESVKFSNTDLIFLCDADMSVPKDLVRIINFFVKKNRVWVPCVFYLFKGLNIDRSYKNGEWMLEGKGMLGCLKSDFTKIGGLNESYIDWGGEDTELWERFHKNNFTIIRNKQKGLIHNWHISHNPKYK
jgi:hypothetical protein